jgi:hypothetical protein
VVVNLRKRLSISKQAMEKYDTRFNFRKLNDVEVKEQYKLNIKNMFAALENLDDDDDDDDAYINRT